MLSRSAGIALALALAFSGYGASDEKRRTEPGERSEVHAAPPAPAARGDAPKPLSREEESELAARAEEPGADVSGGALSNLHLTYAVIALAAVVLALLIK